MKILLTPLFISFLLITQNALAKAAPTDDIPMKQGLHEWTASEGKLTGIVSTYQDVLIFRRNYNFFLTPKKSGDWIQIPLIAYQDDVDFSFSSQGQGDDLLTDGIIVPKDKTIYFVKASHHTIKAVKPINEILVTWFKLTESDDKHPDDPAYAFKSVFTRSYAKPTKLTVEQILKKESGLNPK